MQTLYPLVNMYSELSTELIIEKIALRPREILGLEVPSVKENSKANITLFSPSEEWTLEEKDIQSLSKNTPFINQKLKGRVIGIVNNSMHEAY